MECSTCLVWQSLIYIKRSIDLGMIIGLDVYLSKSIMDVVFSDLECRGQPALLFSISFCLFSLLMFLKYVVFVGQLLYVKSHCRKAGVAEHMWNWMRTWQCLVWCVSGSWVADVKWWVWLADSFLGKEMWHAGKIVTDGKTVHVCIIVQAFVSICLLPFSDHPKDLGKLESFESLECFFLLPSYSFERLRWVFMWKGLFFQY